MASVPQEVIAPTVSAEELAALQQAVVNFDREQLIWSSGFLAGLAGSTAPRASAAAMLPVVQPQLAPQAPAAIAAATLAQDSVAVAAVESATTLAHESTWHVFYATETGNSRHVAEKLAEQSKQAGLNVETHDLREFRPKNLKKVENALFVLATHGIGEPPEGSELFFEFWMSDKAPRLEQLNYSVLALGDSSYADFCEIGRVFDARLAALGATAVVDRIDCDLDFDDPAAKWSKDIVDYARDSAVVTELPRQTHLKAVDPAPAATRENPFDAEILTQQVITGRDSSKDVRHIELDLEGSGLNYLPGDSLGVMPKNPPQLVDALLGALHFKDNEQVVVDGQSKALRDALLDDKEITILSRPLLDAIAVEQPKLQAILDNRERFTEYLKTRQLIDLVHEFPIEWQPQQLLDSLRRLTPRLYSIASSPDANPDEAHLTVSVVEYEQFDRQHWGSASNFLTGDATRAPIYVEPNDYFRLPDNGDTPIVMVGAGTGVAPYRAFVEHRKEHGHSGDNWLIFGDRNFSSDFLYQLEWLRYRKDGLLRNLDVAFSRDQSEKVYVQDRLIEKGESVFDWLERGAHFYVCGDAEYMAADVHSALLSLVATHGGMSADQAVDYVNTLKQQRRYQRDVY